MARGLIWLMLAWPVGEIIAYWLVSNMVGSFGALMLLIGGCVAGVLLMRNVGMSIVGRISALLKTGEPDWQTFSGSGGLMMAGLLLAIPGFITDIIALGLLAQRLRQGESIPMRRSTETGRTTSSRDVIDLEADDWREVGFDDPGSGQKPPIR